MHQSKKIEKTSLTIPTIAISKEELVTTWILNGSIVKENLHQFHAQQELPQNNVIQEKFAYGMMEKILI